MAVQSQNHQWSHVSKSTSDEDPTWLRRWRPTAPRLSTRTTRVSRMDISVTHPRYGVVNSEPSSFLCAGALINSESGLRSSYRVLLFIRPLWFTLSSIVVFVVRYLSAPWRNIPRRLKKKCRQKHKLLLTPWANRLLPVDHDYVESFLVCFWRVLCQWWTVKHHQTHE